MRAFVVALGLFACASDDDASPACVEACMRLERAGCPKTPVYDATCSELCTAARERTPDECRDEAEAVYACFFRDVTFECAPDGTPHAVPSDACIAESMACAECTDGDTLICIGG